MSFLGRAGTAAALVALSLTLAGCGDGDDSSTGTPSSPTAGSVDSTPTASDASTGANTDETPASPSSSTAVTAPPDPTTSAPVATGPTLTTRHVRVTLPAGWKANFQSGTQADAAAPPPGRVMVFVSDISAFGTTLEDNVALELKNHPELRRQADLTVDGVTGFVLSGKDGSLNEWFFGTVEGGFNISVSIDSFEKRGHAQAIAEISRTIDFLG